MIGTRYPYEPHGFLAETYVDFIGLDVPSGTAVFHRIAEWVNDMGGSKLIPVFHIESTALLYHIVFGCVEKLKTIGDAGAYKAWGKIRKTHTDMAYRSWLLIWRMVAGYNAMCLGKTAADEICVLFNEYDRASLVSEKPRQRRKPGYDFELSDLPDWSELYTR